MQAKTRQELFKSILPELEAIEANREAEAASFNKSLDNSLLSVLAIFFAGVIGVGILFESLALITVPIIAAIFILLLNLLAGSQKKDTLAPNYKAQIGSTVLQSMGLNWSYNDKTGIPLIEIKESKLLSFTIKNTLKEDHFTGNYKGTNFQFSQINLFSDDGVKKTLDGDYDYSSSYLILIAESNKEIKGKTVVFPDQAQQNLGTYLGKKVQQWGWEDLDLVYLEDPKFEEYYERLNLAKYLMDELCLDEKLWLQD